MTIHPLAGQPAPRELLVDVDALRKAYDERRPDPADPAQRVSFGTSGHRGSSFRGTFNEAHPVAITQAICDYRRSQDITGPLYMGKDTHALSGPAFDDGAGGARGKRRGDVMIDRDDGYTPTPAISHAILTHNRGGPEDASGSRGRHRHHAVAQSAGGRRLQVQPAERRSGATRTSRSWIEDRANALLSGDLAGVQRIAYERASQRRPRTRLRLRRSRTSSDLGSVVDMDAIRGAGSRSASIRSAAPASPTGGRSRSATSSTLTVVNRHGRPDVRAS